MPSSTASLRLIRAMFWCAAAFTFVNAMMPPRHALRLVKWDKAEHFLAFYVLTALAIAAFPRQRLIWIGAALSAFGAAIELVQGLHLIARHRDFWDWFADTVAIVAVLLPMALAAWRRRLGGSSA